MKKYFFLFGLLFQIALFAQTSWPPVGAFWNYYGDFATHQGYPRDANLTVYIDRDTSINGLDHKVYREVGYEYINYFDSNQNVARQWNTERCCLVMRNDSFINVDVVNRKEYVLMDFSVNVGDSVSFRNTNIGTYAFGPFGSKYGVDTIDYEVIGMDTLRRINYVSKCIMGDLPAFSLEKVGPLGLEDTLHPDGLCVLGDTWSWHFECYSGGGINYPDQCDPKVPLWNSINEKLHRDERLSYLNNLIAIKSNKELNGLLIVVDALGQRVISQRVNSPSGLYSSELPSFHSGIYIVTYISDDGRSSTLKISR